MQELSNKQRILRLLKYLYRNTDDQHPISTNDLISMYRSENSRGNRSTVRDDINDLKKEGFDVVTKVSYNNSYFMGDRVFELPELKLLIDAVSEAQFISEKKSKTLIEKLSSFASVHQSQELTSNLYVPGKVKSKNEQIYYNIDRINEAINTGRRIRFQYTDYDPDKKLILHNDGEVYEHSPYCLVWNNGHYYAVGFSHKYNDIGSYRVDRMTEPEILDQAAVPQPEAFDLNRYIHEQFSMFKGTETTVVMEAENELMRNIVDTFGEDVETWRASVDTFYFKTKVAISPTFYGWVFGYDGKLRIVEPKKLAEEYRKKARKTGKA